MHVRFLCADHSIHQNAAHFVHETMTVVPPCPAVRERFNYCVPAHIPGEDWRELITDLGIRNTDDDSISLFKLADYHPEIERPGLSLKERRDTSPLAAVVQKDVAKWLLPMLGDFLRTGENFKPIGLFWHSAGLPTTTVDRSGYRTGLHLDSWYGEDTAGRAERPGRLTVNLGPGHRYFYAVTRPVSSYIAPAGIGIEDLVLDILERHHDFRVIRLTLPPGYGYIAQTENLIHDGSTINSQYPSYTFTIFGNFNCSNYKSQIILRTSEQP